MARGSGLSESVDRAEAMRRQGRVQEAMESVGRFLRERPNNPRALLLRSRLLYQLGKPTQALEALYEVERIIGKDGELQSVVGALEGLRAREKPPTASAFATESMARLLDQQGYFLEAMEIYRQRLQAAPERGELWEEMARLRGRLEREGSREATQERVARGIEAWDRWLREHRSGG